MWEDFFTECGLQDEAREKAEQWVREEQVPSALDLIGDEVVILMMTAASAARAAAAVAAAAADVVVAVIVGQLGAKEEADSRVGVDTGLVNHDGECWCGCW